MAGVGGRWANVLVRADGRWWRAPVGSDTPEQLSLDDAIGLLRASHDDGERGHTTRSSVAPLTGTTPVAPLPTIGGPVEAGHLVVTDAVGQRWHLDEHDLRLLDSLCDTTRVDTLDLGADGDAPGVRTARLLAADQIRVAAVPLVDPRDPCPPQDEVRTDGSSELGPSDPDRTPVYSIWHPEVGPLLSLGMLTAAARNHDGGRLTEIFDIRPPETAASFLADLERRSGPAVLLCSDYVFTLPANLEAARTAVRINPELVVIHGGPSSPKYPDDAEHFLDEHGDVAHVLTRGEGERTICELLEQLTSGLPRLDAGRLAQVQGITFRNPDGTTIRTADRERIAELDSLPSPFLTGEFDHIPIHEWVQPPYFETTRGCPYGCTFCDWGSATSSRIRKFDLGRVTGEFEWAATKGLAGIYLCDANFGILPRDVEIAEIIADLRRRAGRPDYVMFTPAKNTTRHITRILDILGAGDVSVNTSISLQTTDGSTLDAVGRHNISTDAYLELAADLRRRGHALTGDLLLGLPGQTYESFKQDLQFMVEHEIMPRTFNLRMLPNSPMNAPEYRDEHSIRTNENQIVVSTSSFGPEDHRRSLRLRHVKIITDRYGVLRHVMRFLQWDHGLPMADFMEVLVELSDSDVEAYPSTTWLLNYFDLFPRPVAGWHEFYQEIHHLLTERLGIPDSSALRTVLDLQEFLMPAVGRRLPAERSLSHDYVSYYTAATAELYRSGRADRPRRPLDSYPAATITVSGDPLELCERGLEFRGNSRDEIFEGGFQMGGLACNELLSPVIRLLPRLTGNRDAIELKLSTAMADLSMPERGWVDRAVIETTHDERVVATPVALKVDAPVRKSIDAHLGGT